MNEYDEYDEYDEINEYDEYEYEEFERWYYGKKKLDEFDKEMEKIFEEEYERRWSI